MAYQELSQCCRAFLFTTLGAVTAIEHGAERVEVYENGVGAANLPPMTGMWVGGRSTKGCHPHFLRLMGELASRVAERKVGFVLPFADRTKAQTVHTLIEDGLERLAFDTVSCVHHSPRVSGGKQCGTCFACLGRRQSMLTAGFQEPAGAYLYDLFGPEAGRVPGSYLHELKATLMQVDQLRCITSETVLPEPLRPWLIGTHVVRDVSEVRPWLAALARYRDEWLALAERCRQEGAGWPRWLN